MKSCRDAKKLISFFSYSVIYNLFLYVHFSLVRPSKRVSQRKSTADIKGGQTCITIGLLVSLAAFLKRQNYVFQIAQLAPASHERKYDVTNVDLTKQASSYTYGRGRKSSSYFIRANDSSGQNFVVHVRTACDGNLSHSAKS